MKESRPKGAALIGTLPMDRGIGTTQLLTSRWLRVITMKGLCPSISTTPQPARGTTTLRTWGSTNRKRGECRVGSASDKYMRHAIA